MIRRAALLLLLVPALLLGGCGLSDDDGDTPAPPPRKKETADKPAKLPPGWQTFVSRPLGFTIGVPPAWALRQEGGGAVLTSPDKQVAIKVSADRTDEALAVPLDRFVQATADGLSGFSKLAVSKPRPYPGRYPAQAIRAVGVLQKNGVRQRLALVIIRRERIAAYPVLAASNTGHRTPFAKQIDPVIRSLRGRPVEVGG